MTAPKQDNVKAGAPATDDRDRPEGQPASRGGKKATDTGGAKSATNQLAEVEGVMQTDPTEAGRNNDLAGAGVGPDAVLLRADEEIGDDLIEDASSAQFVTLSKDVVEEFVYPGTKRPAHRLLFTKGQVVPRDRIDALNAGVQARAAEAERDGDPDPKNPAGIDSTTLASGTYPGIPPEDKQ